MGGRSAHPGGYLGAIFAKLREFFSKSGEIFLGNILGVPFWSLYNGKIQFGGNFDARHPGQKADYAPVPELLLSCITAKNVTMLGMDI